MVGRSSSRQSAAGRFNRLLVIGLAVVVCAGGAWAGPAAGPAARPDTRPADAGQSADDLARAAADRFAHAVDRADVAAAAAECSPPWLNAFREAAAACAG